MKTAFFVSKEAHETFDVLGPRVRFLISPSDTDPDYCIMHGTIPAGVSIPIHSHPDHESFYIISGVVQALSEEENNLKWKEMKAGDFVYIPGNMKHAWKNIASKPVEGLITTTKSIGKFFREIGRPVQPSATLSQPTREDLHHFAEVAAKYKHWLGSPEENAAVGISIFA